MKAGKLNWDDLSSIINNNRSVKRDDVRIRSGVGEDCTVVNFGDYECVMSTDPITGADKNAGRLAVHINCNDIASAGVKPLGILVTILAPEGTEVNEINDLMKEVNEETSKLNIEILGGHTEVTKSVNKMIVSCTVIGKCRAGRAVATSGARINDDIIVTKTLGMEGTSIIINDYYNLVKKFLSDDEIMSARKYVSNLSVLKEGIIAGEFGVNSMHDITEGGVLGALWEVADSSGLGFKVYKDRMPVGIVTEKICSRFNIDLLRFISSGSMLITAQNGSVLVDKLKEQGITASIIGSITESGAILVGDHGDTNVDPPERDELFVFYDNYKHEEER